MSVCSNGMDGNKKIGLNVCENEIENLMETVDTLAADLKKTKALLDETTNALSNLRNPPSSAFTNMFSGIDASITCDPELFYSSNNVEGASLDITTGLLSAGYPGSYSVSRALNAELPAGNHEVRI